MCQNASVLPCSSLVLLWLCRLLLWAQTSLHLAPKSSPVCVRYPGASAPSASHEPPPLRRILHQTAPAPRSACGQGRLFGLMPFRIADTLHSAAHKQTPRTCKSLFALHAYAHFSLANQDKTPPSVSYPCSSVSALSAHTAAPFVPLTHAHTDVI